MHKYRKLARTPQETDRAVTERMLQEVSKAFPIEGNFYTLAADGFGIKKGNVGVDKAKQALINGSSLYHTITARFSLLDSKSKKVIDSRTMPLMNIPAFSDKGSFVVGGNSYTVPYQQRLKPSVYTLEKRNGDIESMFNIDGGRNMALKLKNGILMLKVGSVHVSLYSVLSDIGVSDSDMSRYLGKEIVEANAKAYKPNDSERFLSAFNYGRVSTEEKANISAAIKNRFSNSKLDKEATSTTLGVAKEHIDPEVLLRAAKKLILVYNGKTKPDDRENMRFKKVMAPEDLMAEALQKGLGEVTGRIKFKLNNPETKTVNDVLGGGVQSFGRSLKMFITSSSSSQLSEEYNPIMMHMANHLITPMGEGGVGDSRALNLDTKAVHPSHLGFIDPIVSPEGASVGITMAVTGNSYIDEKGTPAIRVLNTKGEHEIVPLGKLWESKVLYPTTEEKAKSDGLYARVGKTDIKVKSAKDVDYIIEDTSDLHAPSVNLLALINGMAPNRTNMAQKHTQQALALVKREEPNVSTGKSRTGEDLNKIIARESNHIPVSKGDGIVTKITPTDIYVKTENGIERHPYVQNMPLARKTFISHTPIVKVGDRVKKNQALADSNFTKNGGMALGKNISVAWMNKRGNRNDGIVITESAAEDFTSEHMYKEHFELENSDIMDMKRFARLFPQVVSKWGINNYTSEGVIKKGAILKHHQPIAFILKKTDARQLQSKLARIGLSPYKAKVVTWHHEDDGEVVESLHRGLSIKLTVKVRMKMKVGDKMAGRFGNKGVITAIIPDKDAPIDKKGNRVRVMLTSAGVISRTNGSSLIEAGLGKITEKTGKRYVIPHYSLEDNLAFMEREAKKHGVKTKEELINPRTGKPYPEKVFVGNAYMMKLFKDGESGMSAVGTAGTDINRQPSKGGSTSAASYSNMEVNGLLGYKAINILKEAKSIKGTKNDEFFNAFRRGLPLPKPAENFAEEKFKAYLSQLNVNVIDDKREKTFQTVPLTDADVIKRSSGKIHNAETIYAKNGRPYKGGLFDNELFGGVDGTRYAYIDLPIKILNPVYADEVARILGVTKQTLLSRIDREGINSVIKEVGKIDEKKKIEALKRETRKSNNPQIANKNIKSIRTLEKAITVNRKLKDLAFISKVPVIPPVYRPAAVDTNGDISINDMNLHYQDIYSIADALRHSNKNDKNTVKNLARELYLSVGAMQGVELSPSKKIRDKKVKGVLDILGGDTPKTSFAQQNLLRVKQFMSGRAVIVPAKHDISIDQVELPEDMALAAYEPHISRELSKRGYTPLETKEAIENKDPVVLETLNRIVKRVPIIYNRAPTLWKHGMMSAFPIITKGKVLGVNPLTESGFGSDYDGDQMAIHVPVTNEAIHEAATSLLPSNNLFNDRMGVDSPSLLFMPDQDSTLGFYKASLRNGRKKIRVKNITELKAKLDKGEIYYNDEVIVG